MKYYIIAGEASGDLHGSNLMKELAMLDEAADFRCWGGDRMQDAGGKLVKHYRELAFMGFWEVVTNLPVILRNLKFCKSDLLEFSPDVLILIDYPGFNLRIAPFAKKAGIKIFYYISPQIWAWKESRVHQIKRDVDKMFVILPFEKAFYQKWNYEVEYVGHPLLDVIDRKMEIKEHAKNSADGQKPVIALLPGSRSQEVSKILPAMLSVKDDFPEYRFVVAGLSHLEKEFYQRLSAGHEIDIVMDDAYEVIQSAEIALVTSGTATLEAALLNTPEIVCYKGSWISYLIGRWLVKVKYISLVNLIMDEQVVPELIQGELNRSNLRREIMTLKDDHTRKKVEMKYDQLRKILGGKGASKNAAALMTKSL